MKASHWVRLFEWLIFVGLLLLLAVGARAWQADTPDLVRPTGTPTLTATLTPLATVTLPPIWTPTPTPTQTPVPTRTPTPTITPTPTATPGPIALPHSAVIITSTGVISAALPQPTPMPLIAQPAGTINVLLLGSDRRPGVKVSLTDVIMIASIYPKVPAVSLISIPRDFYAWIPTWGLDKINTAYLRGYKNEYPGGGPGMIKATIEYNFGIPIHYYAMVDFNSYSSIVDAVGGVDIVVECPFHDTYPDEESATGQTDIDLYPGIQHLNGKYALWYVRSRWNTSDFDRHRRQQQVIRAIMQAALSQNMIPRIPDMWGVYQESVETDMGLKEVLYFGSLASRFDMRDLKSRFVRGATLLTNMTAPNGGAVLAPDRDALYAFMQEAAQPPVASRTTQRAYRVEVWNGTGNTSWGDVAAYRLALEGFEVISIEQVGRAERTALVDFTTTSKGSPIARLMSLYKLQSSDVTTGAPAGDAAEAAPADFRVILGSNYDPCLGTVTAHWQAAPVTTPTPAPNEATPAPDGAATPETQP